MYQCSMLRVLLVTLSLVVVIEGDCCFPDKWSNTLTAHMKLSKWDKVVTSDIQGKILVDNSKINALLELNFLNMKLIPNSGSGSGLEASVIITMGLHLGQYYWINYKINIPGHPEMEKCNYIQASVTEMPKSIACLFDDMEEKSVAANGTRLLVDTDGPSITELTKVDQQCTWISTVLSIDVLLGWMVETSIDTSDRLVGNWPAPYNQSPRTEETTTQRPPGCSRVRGFNFYKEVVSVRSKLSKRSVDDVRRSVDDVKRSVDDVKRSVDDVVSRVTERSDRSPLSRVLRGVVAPMVLDM